MKTRKVLLALLLGLSLVACSDKENKPKDEAKNDSTEEVEKNDVTSELNEEELIKGDFSSIAGEYENSQGEMITINNQGFKNEREEANGELQVNETPKRYTLPLKEKDAMTGYAMSIFPVGTEIETLETDTTKVRISYGHDLPMSIEEVYVRK